MARHQRQQVAGDGPGSTRNYGARAEWALFAAIMVFGIGLRITHVDRPTVEHFDEGVYSSNLFFGASDQYQYPQRHLYAPPLVPWLIEWTLILRGEVSGFAALLPSLFAGCMTTAAVWWLAYRAFGKGTAFIAAAMCASSGLHILLTRSALTDVFLLFAFHIALALFESAFRSNRWSQYVLAGFAVAFAWWTKYNGWLPLLVAGAALGTRALASGREWTQYRTAFLGWCTSAVVAVLLWSPYLWSLQSKGGYSAVAANHRRYVVGIEGWITSFQRQLGNMSYVGSWWNDDLTAVSLGAIGAVIAIVRFWRPREQPNDRWMVWLVATWFLLLGIMTPLYSPYPRLLLPWLASCWILGAFAIDWVAGRLFKGSTIGITTACVAAIGVLGLMGCIHGRAWEDRTGLQALAEKIQSRIQADVGGGEGDITAIDVYGEPALFFQMRAIGPSPVSAVQDIFTYPATANGLPIPTYLVVGPHARRDPKFLEAWSRHSDHYRPLTEFIYRPSALVLLDNYSATELRRETKDERIEVFRMR